MNKTLDQIQKGDVVVNEDGDERTVLARVEDIVCLSDFESTSVANDWYTIEELKNNGHTLKPTPQPKWEPKDGEDVWFVHTIDGFIQSEIYTTELWGKEYKNNLIYPLTHRQQAQEALERVLEVLKEMKEKNL
jgi:hypothetical protein